MSQPPSFPRKMSMAGYEFTSEQRRTLDRYIVFLSTFVATHDNVNLVFARRARSGHQRTHLPYDSRLNYASSDERNLQALYKRVEALKSQTSEYIEALLTFRQEALEYTARTSRSEPVDQVDVSSFSIMSSPIWRSSRPRTIKDLVYGLGNLFFAGKGDMLFIEMIIQDVHEHSYGLKSIFTRAMGYRTCECHSQPIVAAELFKTHDTIPRWSIEYSSSDPVIKAREYEADVTQLFDRQAYLCMQIGAFFEEVTQRFDSARLELTKADDLTTMGRLNVKLATSEENAVELLQMLTHIERWLRK